MSETWIPARNGVEECGISELSVGPGGTAGLAGGYRHLFKAAA